MKVARTAIIDEEGRRFVEMMFEDDNYDLERAAADREQYVSFRVDIDQTGYPRLPEAEEESLRHVRDVIDAEIRRLTAIRE